VSQNAGEFWAWIARERGFVKSAKQGVMIALMFSFLILLLATRNIILSFFSIFCVGIVILSEVAIIVSQGWQLGISESISVVIIIGLSVDYCVHLATDYQHQIPIQRK
jgi:predicted RND superfamily exporter protein